MLASWFSESKFAAVMPCREIGVLPHRSHEPHLPNFAPAPSLVPTAIQLEVSDQAPSLIPLCVTKLLDRSEVHKDHRALTAIKEEGRSLVEAGTWLEDTVIEKDLESACQRVRGEGPYG